MSLILVMQHDVIVNILWQSVVPISEFNRNFCLPDNEADDISKFVCHAHF